MGNYCLRFVDASFYQVARGLLLPFTVLTSYFMLRARPSLRIILSCAIVTLGFFVGVFLDQVHVSGLGIFFGMLSSLMTALHAAVMKRGFEVVDGSALAMSWYSNLLSSILLIPFIILVGEGPAVLDIISGRAEGLSTFLIGSAVTVSTICYDYVEANDSFSTITGQCRISALHRHNPFDQDHIPDYTYDFFSCSRCRSIFSWCRHFW